MRHSHVVSDLCVTFAQVCQQQNYNLQRRNRFLSGTAPRAGGSFYLYLVLFVDNAAFESMASQSIPFVHPIQVVNTSFGRLSSQLRVSMQAGMPYCSCFCAKIQFFPTVSPASGYCRQCCCKVCQAAPRRSRALTANADTWQLSLVSL